VKDGDYESFLEAIAPSCIEVPMPVLVERWQRPSVRRWSDPAHRQGWLAEGSVPRPGHWLEHVNATLTLHHT